MYTAFYQIIIALDAGRIILQIGDYEMPKVWIEQGVYWNLLPIAQEGFRKVCAHAQKDVYITSGKEGDHQPGSLHYSGLAWDMRKSGYTKPLLLYTLPGGDKVWDVVEYDWGFHVEYDPK